MFDLFIFADDYIYGETNIESIQNIELNIIADCAEETEKLRKLKNITFILSPNHTGSYDFLIVRLVAIWSATTDRQCLLRSPFTIARSGVFFTIGCRSYANLHDYLCIYTFWPAVGRFIVNNVSK